VSKVGVTLDRCGPN